MNIKKTRNVIALSAMVMGMLAGTAKAAVITPTGASSTTTVGGSRTIAYTIDGSDLSLGGLSGDIPNETHAVNSDSAGYWLSGSGAPSGTEVLTFAIPTSDVNSIYHWRYSRSGATGRALKTFDISFSTDDGASFPTTITAAALGTFALPSVAALPAETKTFALQTGVTHIRLSNLQNWGDGSYFGLSEIRFGTPEVVVSVTLSDLLATDITTTSASVSATLGGTNGDVTVYWKPGDATTQPYSHTGWEGADSPNAESTGVVTRAISPLAYQTLYTYAFYATNSVTGTEAWNAATFVNAFSVYEGFSASASGAGDDYPHDATLNGAGDIRTGMINSWGGSLKVGEVDFVSRDDNMSYPGLKTGDAGVVEYYTTRTTDQAKSLGRYLAYTAPDTNDFYIVLGWATTDPIAHGISLPAPGLPSMTLSVTAAGAVSVNFGGAGSNNYSGGIAHMDGSWNLLIIRAIDTPTAQSVAYYDAYELWLNPTIAPGSGDLSQLGTPDATGDASLRNNNGPVVSFSYVGLSATLQSPETIKFDELRITTELSDFLPVFSSPAGTMIIVM